MLNIIKICKKISVKNIKEYCCIKIREFLNFIHEFYEEKYDYIRIK